MSEVQSRPFAPRGRGSGRGGRGGSSGGRGSRAHGINGKNSEKIPTKTEEEDEVGQLKKLYSNEVTIIKEMFPDWTDEDTVFALRETDGNLELTVERITDGTISQWGEVSKAKKDRLKSKAKESLLKSSGETINHNRLSRSGRTGYENSRGNRGRGTDRGRGSKSRGTSAVNTASTRWTNPSDDFAAWKKPANDIHGTSNFVDDSWEISGTKETSVSVKGPTTLVSDGAQKSWATLFATTPVLKKSTTHSERPAETTKLDEASKPSSMEPSEPFSQSIPGEPTVVMPLEPASVEPDEANCLPSSNTIIEDDVGQLPDTSASIPTTTVAGTVTSSWDHRGVADSPLSYDTLQHNEQPEVRTAIGYQSPAIKASSTSGRTLNYQRRIFDQEEAVRMPGNREVDRAAVQFGAFNLKDNSEEDVDGGREEAETRAQPPQHSPVAPRASLPPVNQQPTPVADSLPTPKPIVGLPAASLPSTVAGLTSPVPLSSASVTLQQTPQVNGQYSQYGRFSQGGVPDKSYDTFNQHTQPTQNSFEGYPEQQTQTQQHTTHSGAFSSAPTDYSSYYTTDPQQRNIYNSYYQQQFGSQHQTAQATQIQDGPASHHRSYNGYSGPPGESPQFQQSASHQPQSRYVAASESHNSGHTTPNPISQTPQPSTSNQASQPQASQQPQVPGTYQYGHPYYTSPYYSAYMNQYPGYGTGNYPGGPYGAKTGIHQHYQGYNISPGPPYEHSVTPGSAAFGVSSIPSRDSALGVLSEYGRTTSAQSIQNPQIMGGSNTFGTGHDGFSRSSSYQGQGQPHYGSQQVVQQNGDDVKSFNDSKTSNGPNPSMQGGRPGSATNTIPGNSTLPPQSQQAGYGSYPAHLQQPSHNLHGSHSVSQYGALGGTGLQHQATGQGHQGSQYGAYQGFGAGNYYSNSQQRGGWGGNYGH